MIRNETPEALAPGIDFQWREAFVVELRLNGVSGAAIAEALVEVEAHCRESGQGAEESFGPAAEYARALELPDESGWTAAQLVRTWIRLVLFVGGFWFATWGGLALLLEQRAEVAAGWLVSGGVTIILMILVFVFGNHVMRLVVDHVVWAAVAFVVALALTIVSGLPFQDVLLGTVPAVVPLLIGLAAIVAGILFTVALRMAGKSLDDPITSPNVQPRRSN